MNHRVKKGKKEVKEIIAEKEKHEENEQKKEVAQN